MLLFDFFSIGTFICFLSSRFEEIVPENILNIFTLLRLKNTLDSEEATSTVL